MPLQTLRDATTPEPGDRVVPVVGADEAAAQTAGVDALGDIWTIFATSDPRYVLVEIKRLRGSLADTSSLVVIIGAYR